MVGVPARVPHTALAERELVLRVHERCGIARSQRVDATCPQHAVGDDLLVLAVAHRAAALAGELLTDHLPLPHATSPQSKRGDQEKRQEDRKLEQGAAQEGIQKIDVGRIRYGWCVTRGGGCERCKQRQCVVDHGAAMAREIPTIDARMPTHPRSVCIASPRNAPKMPVDIACPPSPKSAYRPPSCKPYGATPVSA